MPGGVLVSTRNSVAGAGDTGRRSTADLLGKHLLQRDKVVARCQPMGELCRKLTLSVPAFTWTAASPEADCPGALKCPVTALATEHTQWPSLLRVSVGVNGNSVLASWTRVGRASCCQQCRTDDRSRVVPARKRADSPMLLSPVMFCSGRSRLYRVLGDHGCRSFAMLESTTRRLLPRRLMSSAPHPDHQVGLGRARTR